MKPIRITRYEWEILAHRLEAFDALAEALTDHHEDDEPTVTNTEVEVAARAREIGSSGPEGIDWDSPLDIAILRDCVAGSTYLLDLDDAVAIREMSNGKRLSILAAAWRLERKLGETFPR